MVYFNMVAKYLLVKKSMIFCFQGVVLFSKSCIHCSKCLYTGLDNLPSFLSFRLNWKRYHIHLDSLPRFYGSISTWKISNLVKKPTSIASTIAQSSWNASEAVSTLPACFSFNSSKDMILSEMNRIIQRLTVNSIKIEIKNNYVDNTGSFAYWVISPITYFIVEHMYSISI